MAYLDAVCVSKFTETTHTQTTPRHGPRGSLAYLQGINRQDRGSVRELKAHGSSNVKQHSGVGARDGSGDRRCVVAIERLG